MTSSALPRLWLSIVAGILVGASFGFWWGLGTCLGVHGVLFGIERLRGTDV